MLKKRCQKCSTTIDYHDAIKQWWHVVRVGHRGVLAAYRTCRDAYGNDIGNNKAEPHV